MKFNIKTIAVGLIGLLAFSSCNKWVDVAPKDRLTDKVLFSSKEGFMKALNGIYSELNNPSLYGRDLTMGTIDVMAQYYVTNVSEHQHAQYATYNYSSDGFKGKSNVIWSRMYTLIANANVILARTKERPESLPGAYSGMVKGEALALRALLHFDILRMFGPIYALDKDTPTIPYSDDTERNVKPLLSSAEITSRIIADLEEARALLAEVDPVLEFGPRNFAGDMNNDMFYRNYKLNYFAVTALLARVHLWRGQAEQALAYAQEVIQKGQVPGAEFFPFVTLNEIRPGTETTPPDRVFSKEILFGLYNTGRVDGFNSLFSPTLSPTSHLTFAGSLSDGRVSFVFDNQNDFRRSLWTSRVVSENEVVYFNKYDDVTSTTGVAESYRYIIPLIRISEMYLIVAECSQDLQVAGSALNKLRLNRGIHELEYATLEDVARILEAEYIREFIGEGQLYYYYKRNAAVSMADGNRPTPGVIPMQLVNYIMPLPDSETSQRID